MPCSVDAPLPAAIAIVPKTSSVSRMIHARFACFNSLSPYFTMTPIRLPCPGDRACPEFNRKLEWPNSD